MLTQMIARLRAWLFGSLRRQLVTGMVLTIAGMLIPFVLWVTANQASEAQHEQVEEAEVFANNLAASSAVWLSARDVSGLADIVASFARYSSLRHALVTDRQGQVLAHSNASRVGKYLLDLPSTTTPSILRQDELLVDVVAPIMLGGTHIGWARIGLDQAKTTENIARIQRNGLLFSLVALVIGVLLATYAAQRLTRRLSVIREVASVYQREASALRAEISGADEAAMLASQFNAMLDKLDERSQESELARRALQSNEKRLRSLFELSPVGIALNDFATGAFLETNDALIAPSGYTREEFVSLSYWDLTPKEYEAQEAEQFAALQATGRYGPYEKEYIRKDGSRYPVLLRGVVVDVDQRKLIWSIAEDISERKLAEHALIELNAGLEQRVNERTAELTANRQALEERMLELVESRSQLLVSQETLSKLIRSPVLSAGLEVALGYMAEQVAGAFDIARASIWRLSQDTGSIQCLDLWEATTRQHSSGLVLSANDFPAYFKLIRKDRPIVADDAHRHPATCEFSGGYLTPLGITSMLDVPIHVNGKLWGVMCLEHIGAPRTWAPEHVAFSMGVAALVALIIEKSLRREAEALLLTAKDNAEKANAAKSEFLSRMSHELRTPLNAIIGFSQMLALPGKSSLTEQQADNVQEILKAGQHLLVQVNEVLDLARIESGRIELSLEPLPLAPLIKDCVAQVQPLAAVRGITIAAPLNGAVALQGDYTRVKQVLLNLLSNAIKYNCDGGQIHIAAVPDGERLRIEVRDTGRGIAPDKRERLFKPFERLESSYDGIEGTGIGLALVKRLIEAMGGEVGVDSEAEVGSTFWFVLPAASLPSLPATPPQIVCAASAGRFRPDGLPAGGTAQCSSATMPGQAQHCVLYIEDNPANLKLIRKIIGLRPGFALLDAMNAELGLEIARREQPDLILLDINLPGMGGFAAIAQLRAWPETASIPVIAVTANAMQRDIERGKAAGFADYLTKPIDIARLNQMLDALPLGKRL